MAVLVDLDALGRLDPERPEVDPVAVLDALERVADLRQVGGEPAGLVVDGGPERPGLGRKRGTAHQQHGEAAREERQQPAAPGPAPGRAAGG